jgi:hypothetical protein
MVPSLTVSASSRSLCWIGACTGLGQSVTEQLDGFGLGDAIALGYVEELQETVLVEQLIYVPQRRRCS